MGGQIDMRADAAIAGMTGAMAGRGLVTLIRRLFAGYDGQRPAGLIAGCIRVCAGELRLEPDQLLVQLVDRADDALAAHRPLLRPVRHLVHGSASSYCREYSRCPVVVVPPGEGAGR